MPYVRHRSRMVQQSVFEDLRNTLIACRWLAGTTTRPVVNPATPMDPPTVMTVGGANVYPLARGNPITLIDYFPEAQDQTEGATKPNTFAMDTGQTGDPTEIEMGTNSIEQPFLFNFAFWAVSDAVAEAVYSDLTDRYAGRIVAPEAIELWNYGLDTPAFVGSMDVERFRYARDVSEASPSEAHLFFGELHIVDYVYSD